jgi:hypothetical protein
MPARADRRAPRIHSLLTRLATKPDEKYGLNVFQAEGAIARRHPYEEVCANVR